MRRPNAVDTEQQSGIPCPGPLLQHPLRLNGVADGVAHHQHLRPAPRGVERKLRHGPEVCHDAALGQLDALAPPFAVDGPEFGVAGLPDSDGGIRRVGRLVERQRVAPRVAARGEPLSPSRRAERGGHEQRVAARDRVGVEQRLDDAAHVGVRCVHLVHHQQVAGQARGPQVRVAHLERGHHRLVHRAHGDLCGQVALGTLRRPGTFRTMFAGRALIVLLQTRPRGVCPGVVAWNGEDNRRRALREQPLHETLDAPVNLAGGGAGGQREVDAVDELLLVHSGEPPQRRLGLAGAGLGLEDDDRRVQRRLDRGPLYGVGREPEERVEAARAGERIPLRGDVQPDLAQRARGPRPGDGEEVVVGRLVGVCEPLLVGADPVGERAQPQEHVLELRPGGQRERVLVERGGEPPAQQRADAGHLLARAQFAVVAPQPGVGGLSAFQRERPAVVRQRGDEQPAHRLGAVVVPGVDGLPPPAELVEEPAARLAVVVEKHWDQLAVVAGVARPAPVGMVVAGPHPRLEADVDLADVVDRGEQRQARRRLVVERGEAAAPGQAPPDGRLRQQRLEAGAHVGRVVLEQVDLLRPGLAVGLGLRPESAGVYRLAGDARHAWFSCGGGGSALVAYGKQPQ